MRLNQFSLYLEYYLIINDTNPSHLGHIAIGHIIPEVK